MDWSEFLNPRNKAALQSLNSIDVFERKKLLRNTINTALNAINFAGRISEDDTVKINAEHSVLTLYTVCVKHNLGDEEVLGYLKGIDINAEVAEDLLDNYRHCRGDILKKLIKYGHYLPTLKHVNWSLCSKLKSTGSEQMAAELIYKITLEGLDESHQGGRHVITSFECTVEELQSLVAQLKEVERFCAKFAENKV